MAALRKRLPEAVVIKHRDASFIGLPDCSVTWGDRVTWLEFKLWQPPQKWDGETCDVPAIAAKSPAQFDMMKKLNAAALAMYIVWAKKSGKCFIWCPYEDSPVVSIPQPSVVGWVANMVIR
jgi:hypothetical protein